MAFAAIQRNNYNYTTDQSPSHTSPHPLTRRYFGIAIGTFVICEVSSGLASVNLDGARNSLNQLPVASISAIGDPAQGLGAGAIVHKEATGEVSFIKFMTGIAAIFCGIGGPLPYVLHAAPPLDHTYERLSVRPKIEKLPRAQNQLLLSIRDSGVFAATRLALQRR